MSEERKLQDLNSLQTMADIAKETIEQFLEALPPALHSAAMSVPIADTVYAIGREYRLTIEAIGVLAQEVIDFISGATKSEDFVKNLLTALNGNRELTAMVAEAVNNRIFIPIREALKKATAKPEAAPPPPPPPKPKPMAPPPRPAAPLRPKAAAGEARKPEPLIITPLPMSEEQKRKIEEIKRMEELIAPRPMPAPPPIPKKPQEAPKPLPKVPLEETRTDKEKPAPIIAPLGIQPRPVMPPADAYQRAREAVKKELKEFQKAEEPKAAAPPSPYVITKEELQKEIEKFRPRRADQIDKDDKSDKNVLMAERQLKLPAEKMPKPQAPERYTADPYKEPFE